MLSPDGRLIGGGVWTILIFLIDSFVFMLIGLQLPVVLDNLSSEDPAWLVGIAVAVSLTVILARIVWVFPATYLPRILSKRIRTAIRRRPRPRCSSSPGPGSAARSRWRRPCRCRSRRPRSPAAT